MSRKYSLGTLIELCGEFKNNQGGFIDPTTVSCEITNGSGGPTLFVYPATITRDSLGRFSLQFSPTAGNWSYRWFSTGSGQGADSGKFEVR